MRINIAGVTHVDGGDGNNPLRTRRMTFENGAVVTEILLHRDDDTRRLYGRTLDDNPLPSLGAVQRCSLFIIEDAST